MDVKIEYFNSSDKKLYTKYTKVCLPFAIIFNHTDKRRILHPFLSFVRLNIAYV